MGFIGLCLLGRASDGTITAHSMEPWYASMTYAPLTPPDWLFALALTALYIMLGISGWTVWHRKGASRLLRLWGWQLAANALWMLTFLGLHSSRLGPAVMALMLTLIGMTIRSFRRVRIGDGALRRLVRSRPYLNAGFCLLKPS